MILSVYSLMCWISTALFDMRRGCCTCAQSLRWSTMWSEVLKLHGCTTTVKDNQCLTLTQLTMTIIWEWSHSEDHDDYIRVKPQWGPWRWYESEATVKTMTIISGWSHSEDHDDYIRVKPQWGPWRWYEGKATVKTMTIISGWSHSEDHDDYMRVKPQWRPWRLYEGKATVKTMMIISGWRPWQLYRGEATVKTMTIISGWSHSEDLDNCEHEKHFVLMY